MLDTGHEALDRADWSGAQAAFEAALASGPSGLGYQGLAISLYWQTRLDDAMRAMERAYAQLRHEGHAGRAAWAALWLAGQYVRVKGNPAAARGWASRCERLLAEAEPCAETGRVILIRALATNDWELIEQAAERSVEIARRFGDTDYEALGVAYWGLAMLSTGRLSQGLALLDEAMAAATAGEVRAPEAVGQIYCALLSGCEQTVDLQRAEQWSRVAQPFLAAYEQVGMTGSCRAIYAGVLTAAGRWSDAERELQFALRTFDVGSRAMRVDALVRLADLRVRQGRLDEAAGLLDGSEGHPDAQRPMAELEMALGRPHVAAALLERRVKQLGDASLQAAPLLACLVEAHIAAGDSQAARLAAGTLVALSDSAGDSVRGLALLATGLCDAGGGRDPVPALEVALDHLERVEMPWEKARARLAIAEAVCDRHPDLAVREARLAMSGFAAIGAQPGTDRAASLLRRLGVRPAVGGKAGTALSRREEEVARLVGLGLSNDQIAARLFLSQRTVESHVSSILRKLAMASRVEIAAYVARRVAAGRDSVQRLRTGPDAR
jgi:DNA-binding CsgD family transcriptional regulator/tetratricopeptide (TPR) repeat protein